MSGLSTLLASLTSTVLVCDARTLDESRVLVVGSIVAAAAAVTPSLPPVVVAGAVIAPGAGRWPNALGVGDEVARSLGSERRARPRCR